MMDIFEELNKLYESSMLEAGPKGIRLEVVEDGIDYDDEEATLSIWIDKDGIESTNICADCWCRNFDIDCEWEPDSRPTYVPHGESSVLYDDGSGGLESAAVVGMDVDFEIKDYDVSSDDNLSDEEIKAIFDLNDAELKELYNKIKKLAIDYISPYIESYVEDDSDYWPDRDSDSFWDAVDYYYDHRD